MRKIFWALLLVSMPAYPAPEKPKAPVVFTNTVKAAELFDLLDLSGPLESQNQRDHSGGF